MKKCAALLALGLLAFAPFVRAAPIVKGTEIISDGGVTALGIYAGTGGVTTDAGFSLNGDKAPVVHNSNQSSQQAIEHGSDAGTTGLLSVTFGTAFTAWPDCTCSDTSATLTACDVTARATTGATFKTTGTDVANWICIGNR